ncbi:hypothetical protein [Frondihabitans peucedani]
MTERERRSRRMTAPVHWAPLNPETTYNKQPDGPVQFFSVERDGQIMGYLWFSDTEFAAGYKARESGGDIAFNVGLTWSPKLKEAKTDGLSPSEAVRRLALSPDIPASAGSIRSIETRSVATLAELSTIDD